ncbi:hypothetical protein [Aeromonas salmonicida]|uniref:hypothetical protein n=1 Tax=Aeromonas salmonicida TaxID=645 RepID=UPI000556982F|nr:hypothetical protein [Aeromonas salmonicida]
MQSFNWVDIDGIRYSWDGQGSITCTGQFGYQATMAGDRIDGLDLALLTKSGTFSASRDLII